MGPHQRNGAAQTLPMKAEAALGRPEARYRFLVESPFFGIYCSTLGGQLLEVNPAFVAMLGYDTEAELLGINVRALYRDPGQRDALIEQLRKSQRVDRVEVGWIRKDGKSLTVCLTGRAVRTEENNGIGLEMFVEDITAHRALETQFRQAQKMEAVGRLAGGIAHDFNNLLTAILGYSDLVLNQLDPADSVAADVREIQAAGERAAHLTRQLLVFSRHEASVPQVVRLGDLTAQMEPLLHRLLGEDIVLRITGGGASVRADPVSVQQIIMNLAVNALDAMPLGGTLTIETADRTMSDPSAEGLGDLPPGDFVALTVADTGCGMNLDTQSHLFEPFFTTKERGKGTGLGLSTVYGIVKQSHGDISVSTEVGRGTTFSIFFPRVDPVPSLGGTAPRQARHAARSETILLVEDEASLRALMGTGLRRAGYTVIEAQNGEEALAAYRGRHDKIQLLVTDVVMPQMGGAALTDWLRALYPDVKVLYLSGYTDDAMARHGVPNSSAVLLRKPFSMDALLDKVREVLDGANDQNGDMPVICDTPADG
jgi:two-component system, cell cycle sensor histidine kinase and response regulator CckA